MQPSLRDLLVLNLCLLGCGISVQNKPALPASTPASAPAPTMAAGEKREERELGVRFLCPAGWHRRDMSTGDTRVLLFSPTAKELDTRITLLLLPALHMPLGLKTREDGIKAVMGTGYRRVRLSRSVVGGKSGEVLEYVTDKPSTHRTVEYGVRQGEKFYIVQFVASEQAWARFDESFKSVLASVEFFAHVAPAPSTQAASAAQAEPPADTTVLSHSIRLVVDPTTGGLSSEDRIAIVAKRQTTSVFFYVSPMDVVYVGDRAGTLQHRLTDVPGGVKRLSLDLRRPLQMGQRLEIRVRLATPKYLVETHQTAVQGVSILGQVQGDSSYSSHGLYYPFDEENRARTSMTIVVPKGYVAIGPGRLVGTRESKGQVSFAWSAKDNFPKQLPYGWAVAKYKKLEAKAKSGVPVQIYALPGHAAQAKQNLDTATRVVDFYESTFGPFPFEKIAIAEVVPSRGVQGVSLPGLVLLSAPFFGAKISPEQLAKGDPAQFKALVIPDELSHQYNFYAVGLPNALSEGIAQYTDSLFAEHVAGAGVLKKHFDYYSRNYRGAVALAPDFSILSSEVYSTPAYMEIAFSKNACALHMLRTLVGDKPFFAGLRELFTRYRGQKAGLAELTAAFKTATGSDYGWFFEQWYQRAGYPRLKLEWKTESNKLLVTARQRQQGPAYRLPLRLRVVLEAGPSSLEAMMEKKEQTFSFSLHGRPTRVTLDPDHPLLAAVDP